MIQSPKRAWVITDSVFVQAVQDVGVEPAARETFAARLVDQPQSVLEAGAARQAADRVAAVLGRMGGRLMSAGAAVEQAADDVQSQAWSKDAIVGVHDSLARIKAQSALRVSLLPTDADRLIRSLAAFRNQDGQSGIEVSQTSSAVTRGMALAALAILGMAGEDQAERVQTLLTDPLDLHCLPMAKRTLIECLAVAGPQYENLFCLGRHAMKDTGRCVLSASGIKAISVFPESDGRSIYVPVAMASRQHLKGDNAFDPSAPNASVSVPVAAAAPTGSPEYSPYTGPVEP